MGAWTDAVEAKARIIHGQLAAARALALRNHASPREVELHYFDLLNALYGDEFPFAQLMDSSDLVARFEGPAVSGRDPTVSIVTLMCSDLRQQIRRIAKSIVGLSGDDRTRWPNELDPQLAGITRGSLVIGVRIQAVEEFSTDRPPLPGVSGAVVDAVRHAVQGLAVVARHVDGEDLDAAVAEELPDPAVRDTLMVAASRLAPSGRRGIDRLSLYEPASARGDIAPLTRHSRRVLNHAVAVHRPIRASGSGVFQGVVREVDLDARRFEIRHVPEIGAIRCAYGSNLDALIRQVLDSTIEVQGEYETSPNRKPRLLTVGTVRVTSRPSQMALSEEWH